jgi:Galactose oxidase, central domain
MHPFVRFSLLLVMLLGVIACNRPIPAATSTQPSSAPSALPQATPPPAVPSATGLPATPQLAPSATSLPATLLPAVPSTTSLPTTPTAAPAGWSQIVAANAGPSVRYDHSAVLDPLRQQLVIFGGRDKDTLGDTWIFDLATRIWREVKAAGPLARFGHGALYDAVHRRMLIVMGQGASFFNDVWAFDLDQETWTELKANDRSAAAPRPRYGQSAALDAGGRVLISHGFSDQGRFDDTWAFDVASARWVNLTPASGPKPLKRCLHELIYDAVADRLLLFGGCSSGFGPCPQGDLWAFDLKTSAWTELRPSGAAPAARSNAALVYEAATQTLFLFGGKTEDGASADVWSYDLGRNMWMQLEQGGGPGARSSQATSYDPQTRRALIFGGLTADGSSADLWEWRF